MAFKVLDKNTLDSDKVPMDVAQYYVTTLTNAFTKIGPVIGFLVVGYFLFVKLPFWFFLTNMKKSKEKLHTPEKENPPAVLKLAPELKIKISDAKPKLEHKKREEVKKEEPKKEKVPPKKPAPKPDNTAEILFEIQPGIPITKEDLKKKYHELLKMNHPDKVASLSPEFKLLADKKTKEINTAYAKLLKRVA